MTVKEITQLAAELGRRLQVLNAHVTTAESCTGGGISEAITRIPGSSAWFEAGYVTYSNRQKTQQLNVPAELFSTVGAVSREVVEAMVRGAQEKAMRVLPWQSAASPARTAVRQVSRSAPYGWPGASASRCSVSYSTSRVTATKFADKR
jgi:hypothetical protein